MRRRKLREEEKERLKKGKEKNWDYLRILKENDLEPSFWMSEEWFGVHSDSWIEKNDGEFVWIEEERKPLFPPLDLKNPGFVKVDEVWADHVFPRKRILDIHYLYDPMEFSNLSGKKWKVFRKNVNRIKRMSWVYKFGVEREVLLDFLEIWAEENEGDLYYDLDYVLFYTMKFRKNCGSLWIDEKLEGVNFWDENHRYINYRFAFCIGTRERRGLSEFLRLCFYLSLNKGKLVNDGGSLGKRGLGRFKDKLNPFNKIPIYTDQ